MAVFVPARSLIQPDVLFTFDSSRSNGKNVANDGVLNSIELLISTDCGISWINHVNGLYFDGNVTECSNYSVFSNDFNAAIKNINNMSAFSFEIWFTPYQSYSSVFAGIGDWIPNTDFMSVSSTGLPWWAMYMNNLDAVTASDSSIFTFSAYEASLLSTTHPNHVVFTISSADDLYANVYVNGNLHDQFNEEYQGLLPLSLGTQLILASALNSENQSFNGNVYLVAVYSQALTEYEVQQNFNASISIPLPYVNQSEMLLSANCSSSSSCHLPELIVSTTSSVDLIYARLVSLPSFGTLYDEVNTTTAYRILTVPYNVTGRLIFQFSFSFGLALFDWQGCGLAGCNPMNATFKINALYVCTDTEISVSTSTIIAIQPTLLSVLPMINQSASESNFTITLLSSGFDLSLYQAPTSSASTAIAALYAGDDITNINGQLVVQSAYPNASVSGDFFLWNNTLEFSASIESCIVFLMYYEIVVQTYVTVHDFSQNLTAINAMSCMIEFDQAVSLLAKTNVSITIVTFPRHGTLTFSPFYSGENRSVALYRTSQNFSSFYSPPVNDSFTFATIDAHGYMSNVATAKLVWSNLQFPVQIAVVCPSIGTLNITSSISIQMRVCDDENRSCCDPQELHSECLKNTSNQLYTVFMSVSSSSLSFRINSSAMSYIESSSGSPYDINSVMNKKAVFQATIEVLNIAFNSLIINNQDEQSTEEKLIITIGPSNNAFSNTTLQIPIVINNSGSTSSSTSVWIWILIGTASFMLLMVSLCIFKCYCRVFSNKKDQENQHNIQKSIEALSSSVQSLMQTRHLTNCERQRIIPATTTQSLDWSSSSALLELHAGDSRSLDVVRSTMVSSPQPIENGEFGSLRKIQTQWESVNRSRPLLSPILLHDVNLSIA